MKPLEKKYKPGEKEPLWERYWEEEQVYAWDESQPRENTYVIDTPPPTVSGLLHMGHIFSYTQADFVARYQRMSGKTVFYPMGFDDNGLPTERLVEKVIKKRAVDLGRERFIEECDRIAEEARKEFRRLFESVALSVDWQQEYHTISDDSRAISQLSFLDLYQKGKAYRQLQPMYWDPVDQTAIAQAEVEDKEMKSFFNDIIFHVADDDDEPVGELSPERAEALRQGEHSNASRAQKEELVIGTTRPELIPACVALFYHPEDKRYQHLKGKHAITPLFGVRVPILTDDSVEMDKGTGIMMCCTFGDEADIEKWKKHDLPARVVLNHYGKMDLSTLVSEHVIQEAIAKEFHNLRASHQDPGFNNDPGKSARAKMLAMLKEQGYLKHQETITHAVPCAERSGAPLEIIPTQQWFIRVLDERSAIKERIDQCNWKPEFMKLRAHQWVDGLSWDWCISRQRYFGVPFPVWYSKRPGEEGKLLLAKPDQLPVNPLVDTPEGYSREEVEPEMDVMDTWATSAVSPQLNSRGINLSTNSPLAGESENSTQFSGEGVKSGGNIPPTESRKRSSTPPQGGSYPPYLNPSRHEKLFPADLRPQAHEIIRTWAFYTIVKAHLHQDTIPWKNLMISGWCLAEDKTKMSKSKGNVVTPVDLIEEQGADAVRYWASTSRLGSDTAFSRDVLKIGKKLVTKLWNASKFAAIQLEKLDVTPTTAKEDVTNGTITEVLDQWVLSRLHKAITKATEQFKAYEYCAAREAVEDFFWNDFCDNYLEMIKKRSYDEAGENPEAQQSAIVTVYHVLEAVLKLFAPFVPHITEELYSHIFDEKHAKIGSIHRSGTWPNAADFPVNEAAEQTGIAAVQILNVVRKAKADANVSLKWPVEELMIREAEHAPSGHQLMQALPDLRAVTNAKHIDWGQSPEHLTTEDKAWHVAVQLADEADAA